MINQQLSQTQSPKRPYQPAGSLYDLIYHETIPRRLTQASRPASKRRQAVSQ